MAHYADRQADPDHRPAAHRHHRAAQADGRGPAVPGDRELDHRHADAAPAARAMDQRSRLSAGDALAAPAARRIAGHCPGPQCRRRRTRRTARTATPELRLEPLGLHLVFARLRCLVAEPGRAAELPARTRSDEADRLPRRTALAAQEPRLDRHARLVAGGGSRRLRDPDPPRSGEVDRLDIEHLAAHPCLVRRRGCRAQPAAARPARTGEVGGDARQGRTAPGQERSQFLRRPPRGFSRRPDGHDPPHLRPLRPDAERRGGSADAGADRREPGRARSAHLRSRQLRAGARRDCRALRATTSSAMASRSAD